MIHKPTCNLSIVTTVLIDFTLILRSHPLVHHDDLLLIHSPTLGKKIQESRVESFVVERMDLNFPVTVIQNLAYIVHVMDSRMYCLSCTRELWFERTSLVHHHLALDVSSREREGSLYDTTTEPLSEGVQTQTYLSSIIPLLLVSHKQVRACQSMNIHCFNECRFKFT